MPGSPGRHIANSEPSGPGKKSAAAILLNETDDWKARARAENITRAVKQIEFPIGLWLLAGELLSSTTRHGRQIMQAVPAHTPFSNDTNFIAQFSVAQAFMPG